MELKDLAPWLRFAARMRYDRAYNARAVKVTDCRLFYVLEGFAHVRVGARSYDLVPDSILYLGAGSEYTLSADPAFSLISLNFDLEEKWRHRSRPLAPQTDAALWSTMPVHRSRVDDSPFLETDFFLPDGRSLRNAMEALAEEFLVEDRFSAGLRQSRLVLLLLRLHRLEQPRLPEKLALVHSHIRAHYAQELSNDRLAQLVGYHPYHLNRLYAQATGRTLHEDLTAVRLSHAAARILSTDAPLQEIAEGVGFVGYPHFSACFKRAYGVGPAQYRKRLKGSI